MKPIITKRETKKGYVYRIIIKVNNEYDKLTKRETTYYPEKGVSEAKAEAYAEIFADKFQEEVLEEIKQKKIEIEEAKKLDSPFARMTFRDLAQEWLDSKYDPNNPTDPSNISYRYYEKAITAIDEYNKEFGDVLIKNLTHDIIYKYYKKINNQKKVSIIVHAKSDIKETFHNYGYSYRKLYSMMPSRSLNIGSIFAGDNIREETAKKFCKLTGIPFNEVFIKEIKEEPYAEYTKFGKKKILKTIFEFGIKVLHVINDNPAKDGLIRNSMPTKRRESLSEEQAIKFYEATKDFDIMIQTAMHLSLLTGMRPAEIGGLEWRDIDFSYKTITIERNAVSWAKLGTVVKGTKTNKSRTISIPDILLEQLLKYRKWQEEWKDELGDYYKEEGQVFAHPDGGRVVSETLNKWFKKVRDKAGIPETFTLYNLRHTNLSILVGYVPITTVAQRAGHSTIKTTEEYYIHRVSEADLQASQTLNNVFKASYEHQGKTETEREIEEYKEALEKMKLLGFKTLQEYFEYLNYMKSKGYKY